MEQISPTRTAMLQKKQQIKLANQGQSLLKQKRDAMLMEFMKVIEDAYKLSSKLGQYIAEGQYALTIANAVDGEVTVKSAALATKSDVMLEIVGTTVMGIPLPEVRKLKSPKRSLLKRGYAITGVSSRISETAEKFENIIDVLIDSAALEIRLKRLSEEIQKTNRRVNALEHVVIPRMVSQLKYIRMTLDERAREDVFRLKKVKKAIIKRNKEKGQ